MIRLEPGSPFGGGLDLDLRRLVERTHGPDSSAAAPAEPVGRVPVRNGTTLDTAVLPREP